VSGVRLPEEFRFERLAKSHPRKSFTCGQPQVDGWLATQALQNQNTHLSVTKVLLDESSAIAGFYTLATGQVDFGELPSELVKKLPGRFLPVAVLAWLGVAENRHGHGVGRILLAQAHQDCYAAGQTFGFIAVILDCVDDRAKAFYQHYDFAKMPGHPYRLFLSFERLELMMKAP
jgi:GNAT superfamily N-acetyltransferase